jgi:conjugative transposon TraM protein
MGLNAELPEPARSEIVEDKRTAYEQESFRQTRQERMRTLEDFTAMVNVDNISALDNDTPPVVSPSVAVTSGGRSSSPAQSSVEAYRDMNRTLGTFYERPRENGREKELQDEIESLKNQLENQQEKTTMEEHLELMEKSYQMAARYLPQGTTGTRGTIETTGISESSSINNNTVSGKTSVVPVTGVREQVVSTLNQRISDLEFVKTYSQERNLGFYSPETGGQTVNKNTIRACIHDDQTVSDGLETQRNVRIRLTEPMSVGGTVIPAHTILTGQARIGERLEVVISSIEYQGRIYTTEIAVYDVDGQRGVAIPPSMEANALKEVAANAGTNMGTSVTFSQSAGQQIAADMGRGLLQGTSQYFARKVRVAKVHLKAGHQVFLLPKENLN